MRKRFDNLTEFEKLSDCDKIDSEAVENIVSLLDVKKLTSVLSCHFLLRRGAVKKWIKEVEDKVGQQITLSIVRKEVVPYMQEDGLLCFSCKDIVRRERLFMLLCHETAHFILMRDSEYESLKRVDSEYLLEGKQRAKMLSPVEYCANLITLKILKRCVEVIKSQKNKAVILQITDSLKKQLT